MKDNTQEAFMAWCVRHCRCEPPEMRPCDGVQAGGPCDGMDWNENDYEYADDEEEPV